MFDPTLLRAHILIPRNFCNRIQHRKYRCIRQTSGNGQKEKSQRYGPVDVSPLDISWRAVGCK